MAMQPGDPSPETRVAVLARCPATERMVDTGARWPRETNGTLFYTLIAGGIWVDACPACGSGHGWESRDLIEAMDFAEPTSKP
jgi:hypothetical protein